MTKSIRLWARALRLHQWAKNALIFVPLILARAVATPAEWTHLIEGFTLFCLTASASYIFNDLLDLAADRHHPAKKKRPFASRELRPGDGFAGIFVLAAAVVAIGWSMPHAFIAVLAAYAGLALGYSLLLKRYAIIDAVALAILFTIRIFAGMVLLPAPVSYWLLTFSFFFFLSLALVKRYAELSDLAEANGHKTAGRVYIVTDRPFVMSSGLASAFASCLVFVIYIANEHFPHNIYARPQWLWAICGILVYWLVRIWFLASRGSMKQDPIVFALTDRASLIVGVLTIFFVALAW